MSTSSVIKEMQISPNIFYTIITIRQSKCFGKGVIKWIFLTH